MTNGANENYLVEAAGQKYVLRIYIDNNYYPRSSQSYRFELNFLRFLSERDLPAVSTVERQDGNLLSLLPVPPHGARCAALFHFCPGENHTAWFPDFDALRVRRLGEIVAEIHKQGDEFQSPYTRHQFDLHYLLEEPLRLLGQRLNEQGGGGLEFFDETAEGIRRQITGLGKEQPVYGLIHADLHVGNLHYDVENGYCVLDFDQCAFGWRSYDIATLLNSVAATVPTGASEIQRELLAGYESKRQLLSAEKEAIPAFVKAWTLWDIGETLALSSLWGGHRTDLTEKGTADDYVKDALNRLERMTDAKL